MAAVASGKPRGRRLRRGTRTEDYLAALSGEHAPPDNRSSSPRASTSALPGSSSSSSSSSSSLASIESPFQVQEYLTMLVVDNPHDIERLVQIPRWRKASSSASNSEEKGKQAASTSTNGSPLKGDNGQEAAQSLVESDSEDDYDHVDRDLWLYEHLRRLAIDLSQPFVLTLQEHCSRETCPEMKAGEWLYLCAAHSTANETECCAIDYITHTLDGATALLNSSRYFPSRLNVPNTSLKHFTSIARRLYRIFAHAWYHHRELFDICEASTSLYERFLALSLEYELVPRELLVVPSQREQQAQEVQQEEGAERIDSSGNANADARNNAGPTAASSHKDVKAVAETIRRTIISRQERDNAAEEEMHAQFERRILEKRGIAGSSAAAERASSPSITSTGTAADGAEGRVSTTSTTSATTTSRAGTGAGRTSSERRLFGAEMGDELDILDADDDDEDEDDDYDSSSDDSSAEEDKRIDKTMPVHAYAIPAPVEPVANGKAAEVEAEQGVKTGAAEGGYASTKAVQVDQKEETNKTEETEIIAEAK